MTSKPARETQGDDYEFYPCLVDDRPASIYVNLRHEHEPTPAGSDTRYTLAIRMREPGEHGIGTAAEAAALNLVEEAVIAFARDVGVTYVGRIRTRGIWEIVLYGLPGKLDALDTALRARAGDRRIDVRSTPDAAWSYYRELLLPDDERRQWMDDRRLVQILGEQGDRLAQPRRVDHWAYFATHAGRDAFIVAASSAGFTLQTADDDGDDSHPYGAWVHRVDPIELDHIHDVVMTLVDAAAAHGGVYDGWETSIET